jgi:hypothetical protein
MPWRYGWNSCGLIASSASQKAITAARCCGDVSFGNRSHRSAGGLEVADTSPRRTAMVIHDSVSP